MEFLSGIVANHPGFWTGTGNFETALLKDDIKNTPVTAPVFIGGLARSGSTLLLEILASHHDNATHRYGDFPFLFTPYFWNIFLKLMPRQKETLQERAHGDGMMISSDSPEAMEETLWMAFFDNLHDPAQKNTLDKHTESPAFEKFYREHIQKLLYVRGKSRYVSKGNYNSTRIGYINKIFPDARFIIPVRDPVTHIASLMRQHERFCAGQKDNKRALNHMNRVGHFEFGLGRRPVNSGNEDAAAIQALWDNGEDIRGWAKYWTHIYDYIGTQIDKRDNVLIVRFEDLCANPANQIEALLDFCALSPKNDLINSWTQKIKAPSYYDPGFSDDDHAIIQNETQQTALRFGYD